MKKWSRALNPRQRSILSSILPHPFLRPSISSRTLNFTQLHRLHLPLNPPKFPLHLLKRTLQDKLFSLKFHLHQFLQLVGVGIPYLSAIDSLRYHLLHPDYLYFRIRELQKNFKLRVVLCHVDVEDVVKPLLEVTKTALLHDCTLLCGWSLEECGRYLETIKVYENKSADLIQGQMDMDYQSRLNHALTAVRHVNKTDVVTLGSTFGSLSHIMDASMEDLARCPGIGERKMIVQVKRLYDTFHEPFKRAVPNHAPVSENPIDNHGHTSESERNEDEKETLDASKRQKKEAEVSVRSALKAAFAKYPCAIGKKSNTIVQDKKEEKTVAAQQIDKKDDYAC
ncbi:DNA excision repair protein ERCC-1 isoform X3 [Sesamum indicum]|uniref:DNA excision repair protein ERCC-1 isoform X3 n=1 Tax=Sesamum indicum TaxID=4182 RepID=A0A8M8V284_SESIN|nr:DNA excision repair protein ERCC-1 isoform X3 [Sesamum indicum]